MGGPLILLVFGLYWRELPQPFSLVPSLRLIQLFEGNVAQVFNSTFTWQFSNVRRRKGRRGVRPKRVQWQSSATADTLAWRDPMRIGVREHQRLARDAVSQAVLDSSARLEVTLSMELRQTQQSTKNRSSSTQKERFLFDLVKKLKMHFGSIEPTWSTSNYNSFRKETPK